MSQATTSFYPGGWMKTLVMQGWLRAEKRERNVMRLGWKIYSRRRMGIDAQIATARTINRQQSVHWRNWNKN